MVIQQVLMMEMIISYNGSSTVDYYLCSPDLFQFVCGFDVKDMNMYSDHCPISLEINSLRLPTQRDCGYENGMERWKSTWYQHYLSTGSSVKFNKMLKCRSIISEEVQYWGGNSQV